MAAARIVWNPIWGHVADTRLGRLRTLQLGTIGSGLIAASMFWGRGLEQIALLSFAFAAFQTTTGPNMDVIALEYLGPERMTDYGRIRGWESLGYAAACFSIGAILQTAGARWSMPIFAMASAALLLWSTTLEPDRPTGVERHGRLGTVGTVLRSAPRFRGYLVVLLLVWSGFNAAWNFIALRIEQGGGGPMLVGIGTALGGLVEVPMMRFSSKLGRTRGLRRTYLLGCLIYATGFLLWGLIANPTIASFLFVFEGAGFALLFTTGVVIVGRLVPKALASTGQSMAVTVSFGIAPIVGAGIGGVVFGRLGALALYAGASALTLSGGIAAWFALATPELDEPSPDVDAVI
jgi:PPP family 3-phenylpropionic acid transporter